MPFRRAELTLRQSKRHLHGPTFAPRAHGQATPFEDLQHRAIARQHIRRELLEPGIARNCNEMAHQGGADGLSLISIDNSEGQFGLSGLHDDITPAADNRRFAVFFDNGDQGDVTHEVDVQEKCDLIVAKMPLDAEEAPVERLGAGAIDSGHQSGLIVGPQRTDFNLPSIADGLHRMVFGRVQILPPKLVANKASRKADPTIEKILFPVGSLNFLQPDEKLKRSFDLDQITRVLRL